MEPWAEIVRGRWELDPLGRHEFRWHDNSNWTGWVTDGARQSFDPLASAPDAIPSKAFKCRRDALTRLLGGIGLILLGIVVTVVLAASSELSLIVTLPVGIFLWGGIEVARSIRYLTRKLQPATVPSTPAPPRLDFRAELKVLDHRLHHGKLSQTSYELAAIKLRRKYNVPAPE